MRLLIAIPFCCFATVLHAQKFECPLRNGVVIEPKRVGLIPPHSDPRNGMTIYSSVDSVFCVASGEVVGTADHASRSHSVIVRIDSTIIITYAFMAETNLTKGDRIETGDYIGKPEPFEQKFRLRFKLCNGSTPTDPRAFFNCILE